MNLKQFILEQGVGQQTQVASGQNRNQTQVAPVQQPAPQQPAPAPSQQPPVKRAPAPSKQAPFTPEQEAEIKKIVKKMINDMLKGSVDAKL